VKAVLPAERAVELADGRRIAADLVLFSVGVRPELTLAKSAGLELGSSGGLLVDDHLRTSDPDIYAAGDMVEVTHRSPAAKSACRSPALQPAGKDRRLERARTGPALRRGARYQRREDLQATAAMTGLSETAARDAGFEVGVAVVHKEHHAAYFPGAKELSLKLVYDRKTARLLGAQAFGRAGVDKRIDVLATASAVSSPSTI